MTPGAGAADTVALLGGPKGHHHLFQADLSQPEEVERLVGELAVYRERCAASDQQVSPKKVNLELIIL